VLECHASCVKCFAGGKYGCTKCPSKKWLWKGECLDSCPDFTYESDPGNDCLPCISPCDLCSSKTTCISCRDGFYMSAIGCVRKDECPAGTYPDDETRYCKKCAKACSTCYGPMSKECLTCNFEEGFGKVTEGTCEGIVCGEGTYKSISFETKRITCLLCNTACLDCDTEGTDRCIECEEGYVSYSSSVENRVRCDDCPVGFFKNLNSECKGTSISLL